MTETQDTIETTKVLQPKFNKDGLIPAIVTDHANNEVLMFAYMNADALEKTIDTRQSHFWSRSRQELWHKGATSGDFQYVEEILIDCDQDAIVLKVKMAAENACHTGKRSCFYRRVEKSGSRIILVHDGEKHG